MRAVILAGGKGTRLRPLTDTRPKPLVPFMGPPFAAGLLRRLADVGCREATFLVSQDPGPFAALDGFGRDVGVKVCVETEEMPLDTAGAARRLLRGRGGGPVIVCNGDILTDLDYRALLGAHAEAGATATIALTRVPDTSSFGVVACDDRGFVRRFVEKPPPGTEDADTVNAGTYVLDPDVFDAFPGDGPLSFERDVFPGVLASGSRVLGMPSDAYWADLGTPRRYLDGHRGVLAGRCAWPVPPALAMRDDLVAVHVEAAVSPEAELGPSVVIGAACAVGAGARLVDAVLHDRVAVGAGAVVGPGVVLAEGVRVGAGAVVGPDHVLGDGAVVPDGATVP